MAQAIASQTQTSERSNNAILALQQRHSGFSMQDFSIRRIGHFLHWRWREPA
jgi:hypothetical protein